MQTKSELLKLIRINLIETRQRIKELEKGKTLEDPIDIDIVKSLKANFYESTLEAFKKYKKAKSNKE